MQLLSQALLQFQKVDWRRDPELGLIDLIFNRYPSLIQLLATDITKGQSAKTMGRQDSPTVEQVVRAAVFKELKKLDYRQLEYAQEDSYVCKAFLKLNLRKPFSFQVWNKYISRISAERLTELLIEINKIAIQEGLEDLDRLRMDTTVVETNIHTPTNNSLVWDCIKESHRLLSKLAEKEDIKYRDYTQGAKKAFFAINNSKADKRPALFIKQLKQFTKTINQIDKFAKKKDCQEISSIEGYALCCEMERLLPLMRKVYSMTYRKEVLAEKVPNNEKVFSIYEQHTDIIVKAPGKHQFGHKILLADGKSGLMMGCEILKGNPADSTLFSSSLKSIEEAYGQIPRSATADGGFAAKDNLNNSLVNVVFNKVTRSMANRVSSKNMETRLKKWRSGIEASISNLKRGFKISRCTWKGWEHFCSKVMWSVLGYNIRVLTQLFAAKLAPA